MVEEVVFWWVKLGGCKTDTDGGRNVFCVFMLLTCTGKNVWQIGFAGGFDSSTVAGSQSVPKRKNILIGCRHHGILR